MKAGTKMSMAGRTRVIFAQQFADRSVYIGRTRAQERRMKQTLKRWPDGLPVSSMVLQDSGDTGAVMLNAWRIRARQEGLKVRREPHVPGKPLVFVESVPEGQDGKRAEELAKKLPWPKIANTAKPIDVPKTRARKPRDDDEESAPLLALANGRANGPSRPTLAETDPEAALAKTEAASGWTQICALLATKPGHAGVVCIEADSRPFTTIIDDLRGARSRKPKARTDHAMLNLTKLNERIDLIILESALMKPEDLVPQMRSWETAARNAGLGVIAAHDFQYGNMGRRQTWPTPEESAERTFEVIAGEATPQAATKVAEKPRLPPKPAQPEEMEPKAASSPQATPPGDAVGGSKGATADDQQIGKAEVAAEPQAEPDAVTPAEAEAEPQAAPEPEPQAEAQREPETAPVTRKRRHRRKPGTDPVPVPATEAIATPPFDADAHAASMMARAEAATRDGNLDALVGVMDEIIALRFAAGTEAGMPAHLADEVLDRIETDGLGREMLLTVLRSRTKAAMVGQLMDRLERQTRDGASEAAAEGRRANRLEVGISEALATLTAALDHPRD